MAWPNLFVVGASKAGTTLLWSALGAHPDVYMSALKEPHYFSGFQPPSRHPTVGREEDYLALFEPGAAQAWRGEASHSYLWHAGAAEAIAERCPDARIVISLRDPVERAYSAYLTNARLGAEPDSFETVVARELDPSFEPRETWIGYVRGGLYSESVARYLALFPERVVVLLFDDLIRDPRAELGKVFALLGLDAPAADGAGLAGRNQFVAPRNGLAARVFGSARARELGRAVVPPRLRGTLERLLVREAPKPEIEPATRRALEDVYRADARQLAGLLGIDVPWQLLDERAPRAGRTGATM